jgi:uncharacterized protein HemY
MATKDEELNKQLKQIEKLTAEQLIKGIRFWVESVKEEPNFTLPKTDNDNQTKK